MTGHYLDVIHRLLAGGKTPDVRPWLIQSISEGLLLAASSQSPESAFERRWPPGQIRAPAACKPQPQLLGAAAQVQHLRRYADDQRQQQAELRADQQR